MLRSVWQKLSGKTQGTESVMAPALAAAVALATGPQPIPEDQSAQYAALWDLLTRRQLIEVRVGDSTISHQTLIMAIDVQRGLLWLDDLFPSHPLLEIGDHITLRHHRNEEQLSFSTPLVAWGSNYGVPGLAVMLPPQVDYQPRRKYPRVELNNTNALSVKIRAIGHDISYGSVQDISAGGLRLSVPGNLLGQLRHGALLPLCELRLSDELHIRCSARIRAFRLVRNHQRYTQISVEFADLAHERRAQLEQFVNNLQYLQTRELARQSA